jgi:DNA-binding transcriptional LysR family regulator
MATAAVQLGVTQPAVSEIITGLESAFAVRLFDRGAQGVDPTIYGRALIKRGVVACDELKEGIRDLAFLADPNTGEVRIGCPDAIAAAILAPMIRQFCRDFPGIALRVDPAYTPTLDVPELRARKLDIVIERLSTPYPSEQLGGDLNVEVQFDDVPVIAAGANSRWARRRKIDLSELVDEPWIVTPRETLPTIVLLQAFQASNLPEPKISNDLFTTIARLSTGYGRFSDFDTQVDPASRRQSCRSQGAASEIAFPQFSCSHRNTQEPHVKSGCRTFSQTPPHVH